MIKDNSKIVKCPYCGAKKELLSLVSGNTIGATQWSDGKMVAPMLPRVSPVQKCAQCGKYYLEYKQESESGQLESDETGQLSYKEWKEAYQQFSADISDEKKEQKGFFNGIIQQFHPETPDISLDNRDWSVILLGIIHAHNDCHYRGPDFLYYGRVPEIKFDDIVPSQEDYDFFVGIIEKYIELNEWTSIDGLLMKAELYREAGKFDECIETLNSIDWGAHNMKSYEEERFFRDLYRNIKRRANAKVSRVFRIGEEFVTEEERRAAAEREAAYAREQAKFQEQAKDPRWKVCKRGHCFKNTERECRWCGEKEFVDRLDENTPINTIKLFVGNRNGKWLLTTNPDIEGQTERIRNITIEYNGRHKFYYHLDGKNPNPFCTNTIKLDESGSTIRGNLLVRLCDIILAGKTTEITLPTSTY